MFVATLARAWKHCMIHRLATGAMGTYFALNPCRIHQVRQANLPRQEFVHGVLGEGF